MIHSLTKWIGGHGTAIGGAVIDGGNFDGSDPKFTLYNEPDRGYHGLRFARDLGEENDIAFALRFRTFALRNQGPILAPDAAWIFLQGVESLPLRSARHSENGIKTAEFLKAHPKAAWGKYPSFQPIGAKYLPHGANGMVVFGIKGGAEEARKLD